MESESIRADLEALLGEGLIAAEEVADLRERARCMNLRPIDLLRREGALSQEAYLSLCVQAGDGEDGISTIRPGEVAVQQAFPGRLHLENYQLGRLLGKGGMGEVYEARDLRLGRRVSIKFLRGDDPRHVERFMREARSQASVDHEHLCKVYEVDECDGRPFIVMQFINGRTLSAVAGELTLEQKLLVLQKVAEALHHAHRSGLVHRDLKPGNIMAEQMPTGSLKPYVLDFGLAQVNDGSGLTVTGDIMGTPGYMAPEQAAGDPNLDRRTDVYGLGATLYHLLCGVPPFTGTSPTGVLLNIIAQEPQKLRSHDPGLPRDVETIVLKCLEKERDRRYQTAQDLADDLGRFLAGEPIQAKPASLLYRSEKKLRKHRLAASVACVAVLLLAFSLGWGAWRATTQARLARSMTAQVKEIEALTRLAHLSRPHDIRPTYANLRRRMERVRNEMAVAGSRALGPGNYALGWGHLVLSEPEMAREKLELAWQSGFREPSAAYALGLTYSTLYRNALARARLNEYGEERVLLERAAQHDYRDPALEYMNRATTSEMVSQEYLAALIAYCEQRFEDALVPLETALHDVPWLYEAHRLQADLYRDWAVSESEIGQVDEARRLFALSLRACEAATEIGRSDPQNHQALARALLGMMYMDMYRPEELEEYQARGLAELDRALEILPDDTGALLLKAQLHRFSAQRLRNEGNDPTGELVAAVDAVQTALEVGGDPSIANRELGALFSQWGQWLNDKGLPAGQMVGESIDALERVRPEERDFRYYLFLGWAYRGRAGNKDAVPELVPLDYGCAVDAFRQAVALKPDRLEPRHSLATCLYHLSSTQGADRIGLLQEAVDHLEKAVTQNPNHMALRYQLGRTWLRLAQDGRPGTGRLDPALVEAAIEQFQLGLDLNPRIPYLYNQMGWAWLQCAQHEWEHGRSPDAYFEKAIAVCRRGLEQSPQTRSLYHHLATIYYFRGKFLVREGLDPGEDFDSADSLVEEALAMTPEPEAFLLRGSVARLRAEWAALRGEDPAEWLSAARQSFDTVLAMAPDHAEAVRSLGRLCTLEAGWLAANGRDAQPALRQARAYLDRALPLAPDSPYFLLADARWYLQCAALQPLGETERAGLSHLTAILAARTEMPEVAAAAACLAKLQTEPAGGDPLLASPELARAIEANPHLKFEWGTGCPGYPGPPTQAYRQ